MGKSMSNIDNKTLIKSIAFVIVFWSLTIALFYIMYQVIHNLDLTQIIVKFLESV